MARSPGASHYFDASPASPSRRRTVELTLPDGRLRLATDRGVFSADAVDTGTKLLLLEDLPLPSGPVDVVDLGCGYGPIALTLARRLPEATVWAVDVNERARALCTENAAANGITNVRVVAPGDVPPELPVAALLSNPPIRVGKGALHELLLGWLARLTDDGRAWLVVQQHLGADSLARWLDSEGWTVRRLRSRQGYRLLEVGRP